MRPRRALRAGRLGGDIVNDSLGRDTKLSRLLAVGHVTWDRRPDGDVAGGSVTYATATARRLGWETAALTTCGHDFDPARELPGVPVFVEHGPATTRFVNQYAPEGVRHQVLLSRAGPIHVGVLPDDWRGPEVLLLSPLAGEIEGALAPSFEAEAVGAVAQGWVREFAPDGTVSPSEWRDPGAALAGVHVLFVSQHDLPPAGPQPRDFLTWVPMVAVTRGWRGALLHTRDATHEVPGFPRAEVDPTGAGDVFATAFMVCYQETGDALEAAAFANCAASFAVEGIGTTTLGDRAAVDGRMEQRRKLVEEAEWEE
jgi:sugar/nucleoside kinase (ribokinase family)